MIDKKLLNDTWKNVNEELENSNLKFDDLEIKFGTLSFKINYLYLTKDIMDELYKILPDFIISESGKGAYLVRFDFRWSEKNE